MTPTEAKQVIEVLARGIDPETGEVLPQDSPLNSPHVIRALFLAANALQQVAERTDKQAKPPKPAKTAKPAKDLPANAGKAWDEAQEQQLAAAFKAGATVAELAERHQRTTGSITSRLILLGLIEPVAKEPAD